MKRKLLSLILVCIMVAVLGACGGSEGGTGKPVVKAPAFSAKDAILMEDIDWGLTEAVYDGERYIAFAYTNNTEYVILGVEVNFVLKEGVTTEQLSVFQDLQERYEWTEEELHEVSLCGYNRRMADPGEYVSDSPCVINNSMILLESMEQYALMEPDMASIIFIGPDDQAHMVYYDFRSQTYSESSEGGIPINEWSEYEIADLLPEADFDVVIISRDREDAFEFYALGQTNADYDAYVKAVKECGFTDVSYEDASYFSATNADGIDITVDYSEYEEELNVRISGELPGTEEPVEEVTEEPEAEEEPEAVKEETEEEEDTSSDTGLDPEFKAAMDSYEAFFTEYAEFMKAYAEAAPEDLPDMMNDYTEYMGLYLDTMEKLDEVDEDDLTTEELEYYLDVTLRINEKLLEVY